MCHALPTIHTKYTYQVYIPSIHTKYTYQVYIPSIRTKYTYQVYIPSIHTKYTYQLYIPSIHTNYTCINQNSLWIRTCPKVATDSTWLVSLYYMDTRIAWTHHMSSQSVAPFKSTVGRQITPLVEASPIEYNYDKFPSLALELTIKFKYLFYVG